MLKIKRNVNLNNLEIFGFKKLNILDGKKIIAKDVYCLVADEDKSFIKKNTIENCFVQYYFDKDRHKKYCTYPEERNEEVIEDADFDLIKAGLIEKDIPTLDFDFTKYFAQKLKEKQKIIDEAINYISSHNLWTSQITNNGYSYMKNNCCELLEILERGKN